MEIVVGGRKIGKKHKPFIIAEVSANHNQSLDRALKIIDEAAKAGVDAVKIQTYTADTMTIDCHGEGFDINDSKSLWKGKSLYQLYKEAETPWEWHETIFNHCKEKGLIAFSTPFDETSVDFLEKLNCPLYKFASFELLDLPLVRKIAKTGKPLIASTGMASTPEIEDLVTAFREAGGKDLVLLKCTSSYPATPEFTNLLTIPHLEKLFSVPVGLSDHTMGVGASIAAIALGACVIEKHLTLARADGGVDSQFSMEPEEMKSLVVETTRAWQALGEVYVGPTEQEKNSLAYRRSLYIVEDLKKGDVLTTKNLRRIRPGLGLPPKFFETMLGKKVNRDVKRGTPLTWDVV